ncbi:hypothetical protein H5410_020995 [Solanum commersonii]|uniref:Transposase n=1 Tax=Solanum commersonii TaxID=4109 RepID=A0A9J5ZAP9_SOLCO|nr:hypothetical protein H5410_020995 [Solanum commersonii]
MCTWESRYNLVSGTTFEKKASTRLSSWLKKVRDSGECRSWMLPHVFDELDLERKSGRGTHKGRYYGLGSRNDVRRLQSGLEGIGSSRQAEALDSVQIAAMSAQIAKLTAALAESEQRRVAEQESVSEIVQQIKEQVMNLAHRPTTSSPDDTDDESDEDDYVEPTP